MSLYNMMFGTNQFADVLLKMLGTTREQVPRFRDCWLKDGIITIHTRTGGGNRAAYGSVESCRRDGDDSYDGPFNSDLLVLPGYIDNADDEFDNTYANFRYRLPEAYKELADTMKTDEPAPPEKWAALFEALRQK